jgi:alkylation response protein AidB-like acyl-CoA dehydrogenase
VLIDDLRARLPTFFERDARDPDVYPGENVADLFALGVLAAPLPQALGGGGATLEETVRLVEAIAQASPSTALLAAMPMGLAAATTAAAALASESNERAATAQLGRIAEDYAARRFYAACNSEKGAGGSLAATRTTARRAADGRFLLTGEKILASGGDNAGVFFSTAKVDTKDLPGAGIVEMFLVDPKIEGVRILHDWDGFGMRSTESHTVRYEEAAAHDILGFPGFIDAVQPLHYWFCLFAAIPLGCAGAMLAEIATPPVASAALRLRLSEAQMRYEAARAYLHETARAWVPATRPSTAWTARVVRTKTYVTQEATRLAADLFALGGGRHYRRAGKLSRYLADSFAGTALRPPLPLALESLVTDFAFDPTAE